MKVKAKKHLGQHFLKDDTVSTRISNALSDHGSYTKLLEIGPGTGALTKHLLKRDVDLWVNEIDKESIVYLNEYYPELKDKIIDEDFLKFNAIDKFGEPFGVVGNFPYNISSQILFKVYDDRQYVPEVVGMFQKEVAERIAAGPGSKTYGILSVLLQAYYDIEYLFTVDEHVFDPPPRVKSGVIRLRRNDTVELSCDPKKFKMVVKLGFNQRRKTLRNSLKSINSNKIEHELLSKRPEQIGVDDFVLLTNLLAQ